MNKRKRNTTTSEERKKFILNLLKNKDSVTIYEILEGCRASDITIRRDLSELEDKGLLIRTHGGATKKAATNDLFTFNHKMNQNKESKEYICKVASSFVKDNDIIFIDCGSTMAFLPKFLSQKQSLTVITNSLPIASEFINFENIKLVIIGGEIITQRKAVYGHIAEHNIEQYHANKAFIGADGVSLLKGLTSFDQKEASITLKMAENADEVFLLCDSTKIERNSYVRFADLTLADYIITDDRINPEIFSKYKKRNINLINKNI